MKVVGHQLSCCPFTPSVSTKKVLEGKLRRRSSVEELLNKNILQNGVSAMELLKPSTKPQGGGSKGKEFERKQSLVEMSLANDVGKLKNFERRRLEAKKAKEAEGLIPGVIISEGWLSKKGSFRHNWKRRYFVLTSKVMTPTDPIRLYYFANKPNTENLASQEKFAKGTIDLAGASISNAKDKHKNKSVKFDFVVVDGLAGKEYNINAGSADDREKWLKSIKACIEASSKRDGKPPTQAPTLKNNHTTSTETTVSTTSSQLQCLVDLPASFAGNDEIRMAGKTQRGNLDEVISRMQLEVGTEEALDQKADKLAYQGLATLWNPSIGHNTVGSLLSKVSDSKSLPLAHEIVNCLSRILEIEAPIAEEFRNNDAAAAAKALSKKIADGTANPPPAPSPYDRKSARQSRLQRSPSGNNTTFKFDKRVSKMERRQYRTASPLKHTLSPEKRVSNTEIPFSRKGQGGGRVFGHRRETYGHSEAWMRPGAEIVHDAHIVTKNTALDYIDEKSAKYKDPDFTLKQVRPS